MLESNVSVITAFAIYLLAMLLIGVYYSRSQRHLSDYILGGRSLGPWITSMSAEASDMSGWMLMGVPGLAYSTGVSASWIAIGIAIGTYLNWHYISQRLRNYTEIANNSLTMPDYLKNRFHDDQNLIRIISAVFILIFFLIYTSSGFVSGGKLFETVFGMDYFSALLLSAGVVVVYTFLGGFMAVCWTDFIQGCMMFLAIVLVPLVGMIVVGGPVETMTRIASDAPQLLDMVPDSSTAGIIGIISSLAWGVGYFGQPHILVRFMAIGNPDELKKSKGRHFPGRGRSRRPRRQGRSDRPADRCRYGKGLPGHEPDALLALRHRLDFIGRTGGYHEYGVVSASRHGVGHFQGLLPYLYP